MTTNTGARRDYRGARARETRETFARGRGDRRGTVVRVDTVVVANARERGREEEEEDCDVYTVRYGDTLVGPVVDARNERGRDMRGERGAFGE